MVVIHELVEVVGVLRARCKVAMPVLIFVILGEFPHVGAIPILGADETWGSGKLSLSDGQWI